MYIYIYNISLRNISSFMNNIRKHLDTDVDNVFQ